MGFFENAFRSADLHPAAGAKPVGGGFWDYVLGNGGGGTTMATTKTAMYISAFFNAVDIISTDVALLPKGIFEKDGANRNKVQDHPAARLIALRPNRQMIAFDFWKVITMHCILKGECFVLQKRNARTGVVETLKFYEKSAVTVLEKDDRFWYTIKGTVYSDDDILHFKGFSLDGKRGVGVITFAAAQLGVNLESQAYAGEVYRNKGLSYGVIETDKAFTDQSVKKVIATGLSNALAAKNVHRVGVLDDGFKYKQISVTPQEAMFIETNKQGVLEVCRWLNIAPHKLKELSEGTYSNIYQQEIGHVQSTLMRWVKPQEDELTVKLFSDAEASHYVKYNLNSLLRGDLDMKQRWYSSMIYAGVFNRNEVRALEDLNPAKGLDDYLQPTNVQTLEMMLENLKKLKETEDAGN